MNHTLFITGASRGIGKAVLDLFNADGWNCIAPNRSELDLSQPASIAHYFEKPIPAVHCLVNCAATNDPTELGQLSIDRWNQTLQTNLTAAMLLMQQLGSRMVAQGFGRIVNVSSIFGSLSRPGRSAYSASKAGLEGLTRTAALEFSRHGVLVNSVAPGFIDTELTRKNLGEALPDVVKTVPAGRLGKPEEVAELIYFLGTEKNSFITGQCITIDGGFSIQ